MSSVPAEGAYLRLEDSQGQYGSARPAPVGRAQPLHLRLAAYRGGKFVYPASISEAGLDVRIERDGKPLGRGEAAWSVSSDGRFLNLQPVGFFAGGAHYKVRVAGKYFLQSDWLSDRLQWLGLRRFEDQIEFDTQAARPTPPLGAGWKIQSLYLTQPKALDTYIPAALDGQAFVVKPFALSAGDPRFLLAVLPALQTQEGLKLLAEPARATAIEALTDGDAIRAQGSFRMSAMGGDIPFDDMELLAGIDVQGNLREGELRAVASCLKVKGNGNSYHFPWSIVNQVCDPFLRMIGYVVFGAEPLEAAPSSALLASWLPAGRGDGRVQLSGLGALPAQDYLLTAVLYEAGSKRILAKHFAPVTLSAGQAGIQAVLPGFAAAAARAGQSGTARLQVFVGQLAAPAVSVTQ
jgi:hypothetical protein